MATIKARILYSEDPWEPTVMMTTGAGTALCHRGNRRKRIHFRPHGIRKRARRIPIWLLASACVDAAGLISKSAVPACDFHRASCTCRHLRHTVIPMLFHPWERTAWSARFLDAEPTLLQHRPRTSAGSGRRIWKLRRGSRNATGDRMHTDSSVVHSRSTAEPQKYKR